jgi:hypothetical protein
MMAPLADKLGRVHFTKVCLAGDADAQPGSFLQQAHFLGKSAASINANSIQ